MELTEGGEDGVDRGLGGWSRHRFQGEDEEDTC